MGRKVADCRLIPSESNCTLTISGEEEEVLKVAVRHAVEEHGHEDTEELREQIKSMLKDEE
jgi:predicted small metal-binding protein